MGLLYLCLIVFNEPMLDIDSVSEFALSIFWCYLCYNIQNYEIGWSVVA